MKRAGWECVDCGVFLPSWELRCRKCARRREAEYSRKYYQAHKKEHAERVRKYRQTHKKEHAEYMRKYYSAHKKECAGYMRKYSARRKREALDAFVLAARESDEGVG